MFKKQYILKSLVFVLIATFYQTDATDGVVSVDATTSAQSIFVSPEADLIKFCRAEFEKATANSSKQMFNDNFVSAQEKQELLKQAQEEVKPEAQDREIQVQQLFEHKVGQLASRNYTAILNDFLVSGRKCTQSASSNGQANGQGLSGEPKKSVSNFVLDDLKIFSGNKTGGLFNVTQRLFGKNGLAPVSTPAGFSAATYALANPETNKEKLEKRRAELLRLVANPELVVQLREQLNAYAKARSGSFDQILNPILPEPFDQKKHKSFREWEVEVRSKLVNFKEYECLDVRIEEGLVLVLSNVLRAICHPFKILYKKTECWILPLKQIEFMCGSVYWVFNTFVFPFLKEKFNEIIRDGFALICLLNYDGERIPGVEESIRHLKARLLSIKFFFFSSTKKSPGLAKVRRNFAWISFLVIFIIILIKSIYGFRDNYNRLRAVEQLLALLDNLQNMVKCGQSCEKLFSGQSTMIDKTLGNSEFDFNKKIKQLTSRKDHKLTYLPKYRHGETISLFQEFFKNLSVDPNGKVVPSDSKVLLDCFTPMHEQIGEIDLLVSLAELVIKSTGQRAEFAVVDFIHGSDRAIVDGKAVWNTLINREVVVPNDVEIGLVQENGKFVQGNMVTAGNGCGKSVHIIAVSTAVYLAQCLGVAPAKSLTITPFDRFVTQINTVDDPLNNKSLFRVQIRQFGQMVAEITNDCQSVQKLTFVCLDESLSGTKPKYAGPLLAALIKCKLSTSKSFAMLFATHLEHLASGIEKLSKGTIVPVQVKCNLDSTGHFESSTFEINPGPSAIDSAFKVAQEEWVDFMPGPEVDELVCEAKGLFGSV